MSQENQFEGIAQASAQAMTQYTLDINAALMQALPIGAGVRVTWRGNDYDIGCTFEVAPRSIEVRRVPA